MTLIGYLNSLSIVQALIFLIITLVLLVITFLYSTLFCKNTTVTLESHQIIYQTGIFSSKRKIISLESIIDTSLDRGILDKLLNVARVNVSTAGSRSYEASISNVKYELATELHERIHEKIRAHEKERIKHQA